jgi:TusA-related sulfurtransferase
MPEKMPVEVIDARGLSCPLPSDLAFRAIVQKRAAQLAIKLDDPASKEQIERLAQQFGYSVEQRRQLDHYEMVLKKVSA